MITNNYWASRDLIEREELLNSNIDKVNKLLAKQYQRAEEEIELKIHKLYYKIITEAGTEKALVSDLYKFNRYYDLLEELQAALKQLGQSERAILGKYMKKTYCTNYILIGEQLNMPSKWNKEQLKSAINTVWCSDGKKWSDRIWTNKAQLQQSLTNGLVDCIATGASTDTLTKTIMDRCGASFNNANRLARTELSHIYNVSALDKYRDVGIRKYIYLTGQDEVTCEQCGALNGQEFNIDDAETGVNFPPLHSNCKCAIIAKE